MTSGAAGRGDDLTTRHVERARAGDADSLAWIVERFTPLLTAQARHRLGKRLGRLVEPEDVVQDTWVVALGVLPTLRFEGPRGTPTLVRFLATTLLYRVNNLARKHLRGEVAEDALGLESLDARTRGAVTRLRTSEQADALLTAISELPERDREVVVLRGIEQHGLARVAELTGDTPNAVSLRWNRALERLRKRLGATVLDDLEP